jgi:hypothetical protein
VCVCVFVCVCVCVCVCVYIYIYIFTSHHIYTDAIIHEFHSQNCIVFVLNNYPSTIKKYVSKIILQNFDPSWVLRKCKDSNCLETMYIFEQVCFNKLSIFEEK